MYPSFDLFVYYTYWRLSTKSDSKRTSSSLEGDTPEGFAFPSLRPQVFHPESERSYPTVEQQIHLLEYYQRYTRAWVRRQLVRSNTRNRDEAIRLLQSITQHIELRIRQAYRLDLETEQRLRSTLSQQRNIVVTSLTWPQSPPFVCDHSWGRGPLLQGGGRTWQAAYCDHHPCCTRQPCRRHRRC